VIGLVTPSPQNLESPEQALDAVLGQHAHQNLGSFVELDGRKGAVTAARKFLLEASVPESCSCTGVGFTPTGPDP
jgi:hypothetical protein